MRLQIIFGEGSNVKERFQRARYQTCSAQRCNMDFLQDSWHWMFVFKRVFGLTGLGPRPAQTGSHEQTAAFVTVLVVNGGQSTASSSLTARHFRGAHGEPEEASKVDRGGELQLDIVSMRGDISLHELPLKSHVGPSDLDEVQSDAML